MGFATGYADALISVGFGTGLYGSGDYGVSSSGGTTIAYARAYHYSCALVGLLNPWATMIRRIMAGGSID
jgi:hypothetical protein